jgi:hypothetical protein
MRYFWPTAKNGRCCIGSAPPRCVMAAGGNFWSFSLRRTTHSCGRQSSVSEHCAHASVLAWLIPRMIPHAGCSSTCKNATISVQTLRPKRHSIALDSHRVVESQHFVQQRAKLHADPARDAVQRQRRRPYARGRHLHLVLLHQLVHVLERLPLQVLEEGQRTCFGRSSRRTVRNEQQPERLKQLVARVRGAVCGARRQGAVTLTWSWNCSASVASYSRLKLEVARKRPPTAKGSCRGRNKREHARGVAWGWRTKGCAYSRGDEGLG